MNKTYQERNYIAFGLNISSDMYLPELTCAHDDTQASELIIRQEELVSLWREQARDEKYYIIKENFCLIRVPAVGLFKITGGDTIFYTPYESTSDDQMRLYLLGTCLGVALMQRRILPMHGSCIVIDGKAYAIVGDSGAGKSTLASVLIDRGFPYLTDDVIAVTLSEDDTPIVIPAYPQQKLWQESLNHLGMKSDQFTPIYDRETKYAVPNTTYFMDKPMPLRGVFVLEEADVQDVEITPIEKLERFSAVYYNTYRNFMLKRSGLLDWQFDFSAVMIRSLQFYRIKRPSSHFTAQKIAEYMLNKVNQDKSNDRELKTTFLKGVNM